MSSETVAKFYQQLASEQGLQKELQARTAAAAEQAIVSVAELHGFAFSVDELRAHLDERAHELAEEDLANVAGGTGASLLQYSRLGLMSGLRTGRTVASGERCDGGGSCAVF
jgi:predicted ribosomally synthesized peptide with nif11-like leader